MIPNWWGTFIIHTIIILVNWIIKKPIHFLIILLVITFFSTQILFLAKNSIISNNFAFLQNYHECFNDKEIESNKKYVILRLDDIQASYLSDLSIKMMNDWLNREIPFTLAVIPINLNTDSKITNYLKKNQCDLEVALHWFNNRDGAPEFKDISEKDADIKLDAWLEQLKKVTDKKIITFIPPDNIYSTGTINAVKNKQFKIISWEWDAFFDYTVSTYFFDKKKLSDVDYIVKKSLDDSVNRWISIIMIHPQDFIDDIWNVDPIKYKQYIKLLDSLKKEWFSFTTMQDYYDYLKKSWKKIDFFDRTVKKYEFNKEYKLVIDSRKW